jgi:hypothetical protein
VAGMLRMGIDQQYLVLRQTVTHGLTNHCRDLLMTFEFEVRKFSERLKRSRK